jgi:hypothetical protein
VALDSEQGNCITYANENVCAYLITVNTIKKKYLETLEAAPVLFTSSYPIYKCPNGNVEKLRRFSLHVIWREIYFLSIRPRALHSTMTLQNMGADLSILSGRHMCVGLQHLLQHWSLHSHLDRNLRQDLEKDELKLDLKTPWKHTIKAHYNSRKTDRIR